jgi:hypothetical protein
VTVGDGLAQFSNLSFGIPGAAAHMHGSYNLINHKIDLHGQMQVRTKVSNTSSGLKAFLFKSDGPVLQEAEEGRDFARANLRDLRESIVRSRSDGQESLGGSAFGDSGAT